jgi:hypothetical protein
MPRLELQKTSAALDLVCYAEILTVHGRVPDQKTSHKLKKPELTDSL